MTEAELLARYQKEAVPICGWPEWKLPASESYYHRDMAMRLFTDNSDVLVQWFVDAKWRFYHRITNHEGVREWRDWVRVWLANKGIGVNWEEVEFRGQDSKRGWVVHGIDTGTEFGWWYEYDDALLAALAAVKDLGDS